jgi:hypothetical protein
MSGETHIGKEGKCSGCGEIKHIVRSITTSDGNQSFCHECFVKENE